MLHEYSHTKSESLVQIRTIMAEIQHFSRRLFFIGAPFRTVSVNQPIQGRDLSRRYIATVADSPTVSFGDFIPYLV